MLTVVASYRQNVHAYPSGGGDYEVAKVNLGRNAGITVAGALLVDYVLTVAVSISSASQYAAAAIPALGGHEVAGRVRPWSSCSSAMNLRGVRESGSFFAVPTYVFIVAMLGMCGYGLIQLATGTLPDVASADLQLIPQEGWDEPLTTIGLMLPAGPRVLLRLCRPHWCRGHQQRSARVPQAEEPQRRDDAPSAGRRSRSP